MTAERYNRGGYRNRPKNKKDEEQPEVDIRSDKGYRIPTESDEVGGPQAQEEYEAAYNLFSKLSDASTPEKDELEQEIERDEDFTPPEDSEPEAPKRQSVPMVDMLPEEQAPADDYPDEIPEPGEPTDIEDEELDELMAEEEDEDEPAVTGGGLKQNPDMAHKQTGENKYTLKPIDEY